MKFIIHLPILYSNFKQQIKNDMKKLALTILIAALLIFAVTYIASSQTVYKLKNNKEIVATHVKILVNTGDGEYSNVTYVYCDSLGNPLVISRTKEVPNEKLVYIMQGQLTKGATLNDFFSELGILVSGKKTIETKRNINFNKE